MTEKQTSEDELVIELLIKVQNKKEEISKAKVKPFWKTSCSFGKNAEDTKDRVNIQVVRDSRKLLEIYAFLTEHEKSLSAAAQELGESFDGTWLSYPIKDWKEDIRYRLSYLSLEKKQKDLDDLDERVNKLVSPEQRRRMEIKILQQMLNA